MEKKPKKFKLKPVMKKDLNKLEKKNLGGACGPTQWQRNLNGGSRRAL